VEFLQSQLSVEQGRRQRSEERTRVMKNLAEKSKVGTPSLSSASSLWLQGMKILLHEHHHDDAVHSF
jgi:hypothetical protein